MSEEKREIADLVEAAKNAVKELDYAPPGESERDSSCRVKSKWWLENALKAFLPTQPEPKEAEDSEQRWKRNEERWDATERKFTQPQPQGGDAVDAGGKGADSPDRGDVAGGGSSDGVAPELPYRQWMVLVGTPGDRPGGATWKFGPTFGGHLSAKQAIERAIETADGPRWALALATEGNPAYGLYYPPDVDTPLPRDLDPNEHGYLRAAQHLNQLVEEAIKELERRADSSASEEGFDEEALGREEGLREAARWLREQLGEEGRDG